MNLKKLTRHDFPREPDDVVMDEERSEPISKGKIHLDHIKAEIFFEVVYPLWKEMNPAGKILSLAFGWVDDCEDRKDGKRAKIRIKFCDWLDTLDHREYETIFTVYYRGNELIWVAVWNRPIGVTDYFDHVEFCKS